MFVFHQIQGILMRRSILKQVITVIVAYTLIASCAKVSSPAGGPKDREPPVIIKSTPPNGSKFYTEQKFEITFNEYVVLDKISDKFIVSPPMKKKPEVSIKGKSVVVEYEDKLRDSTTYTFNFQDAVRDINEGNVYNNLQFVFSTGPVIDSLSVTGNVLNAFVLDFPDNPLILLYKNLADSAVKKSIPDYISRTDKNGYFRINNVREGKYRLYALKDQDNSMNFNLRDEEMAFLNEPVVISPEKNYILPVKDTVRVKKPVTKSADTIVLKGEYKLILFQHEKTMHYLTSSSRNLPYLLTYTLSIPPGDRTFDFSIPGISKDSYFMERSRNNDTMQVWLTDSSLYATQLINTLLRYPYTDTTGAIISREDSIAMRFLAPRSARAKAKPPKYTVRTNLTAGPLRSGEKIVIESPTPFRPPDTSRIRIYELKETQKIRIPYNLINDSTNSRRISISAGFAPGKNYLYIADSAAYGDIYGEHTDSTGNKISIREEKSFGKLTLNVKGYEGSRIIQLLDKNEKLVSEKRMSRDGKIEFPMLDKGTYRVRVIYDLNNDGKWTTGNFNLGLQPEPVSFYPKEIEIKENWDFDQDWDITAMNIKKLKNNPRQSQGR
jgi:Bacterial Ig-like domain/Polysaccharide lyase family 4, domain II